MIVNYSYRYNILAAILELDENLLKLYKVFQQAPLVIIFRINF